MTTPYSPTGLSRAFATFALGLIATQAGIMAVSYAFPDLKMPSTTGLLIVMVAAMVAGQSFAKRTGRVMARAERWRFSFGSVAIALAVGAATLAGVMAYFGVPISADTMALLITGNFRSAAMIKDWLLILVAASAVLSLLTSWFFVNMGAKTMLKALEKQAAKAKRAP